MWGRVGATAAVVILASTSSAVAQSGSTVDNDVSCHTACTTVNTLDQANEHVIDVVRPYTQQVIDYARDQVNNACSDSCQKPEDPRPQE